MSEGRSVSIVAVDGGYIIEWNDLVLTVADTGLTAKTGEKIKVSKYKAGPHQVAVRATVEEAMKFVAELLLKRMQVKQEERDVTAALSGLATPEPYDAGEKDMPKSVSAPGYAGMA